MGESWRDVNKDDDEVCWCVVMGSSRERKVRSKVECRELACEARDSREHPTLFMTG